MAYFPFFVDLEGKKCLIAGGGTVAYRKASVLVDYGVEITVVAPDILQKMVMLSEKNKEKLFLKHRKFKEQDLTDMDFVVAGTSDKKLNQWIATLCRQHNILINVVDAKEECSFLFPALIKDKDIVVGISTSGNAPTISRYLKQKLKEAIPYGFGNLAKQLGVYRVMVKETVDKEVVRRTIFRSMLEEGIRQGGTLSREQVKELIEREQGKYDK